MANTSESSGNNSQSGTARNENSADGLGKTKESAKTQDPQAAQQQFNTVVRDPEQGRIAAEVAKYDAAYTDNVIAKEERKAAEMASMLQERQDRAKNWTPEEAAQQAQRDSQDYAANTNKYERGYMRDDMALNAGVNPAYQAALEKAAPELAQELKDPQAAQQQLNTVERDPEQGRIASEVAKYDAETHERIERIKKEIAKKKIAVAPAIENEAESIQPAKQKQPQAQDNASIQREDALAAPSNYKLIVPPEIGSKYLQVGNKYHNPDSAKTVAFVDRGDKLQTASSNPQIADDLVKIADARGWQELKVTGTPAFRREVWLEASVRGIHVDGYKPTELDKAELERRSTFVREQNSIEVPSNAFRELPKEQALKKDPGLVNAFATIEAAKVFAQQKIADTVDQQKFVSSVQQEVGKKVDAGEKIPAVKLKTPEGKLIAHGKDHYNFDKDEKLNYYVTLEDSKGRQRIIWGVGLAKALRDSKAQIGDRLRLQVSEQKGVVVDQKIRDQNNQVVGTKTIDSARNVWSAEVLPREQAQAREQSAAPRSR